MSAPSAVNPTYTPATHRWAIAALSGALGLSVASGRVSETLNGAYGVIVTIWHCRPPHGLPNQQSPARLRGL
jgi:hypothetical protein